MASTSNQPAWRTDDHLDVVTLSNFKSEWFVKCKKNKYMGERIEFFYSE